MCTSAAACSAAELDDDQREQLLQAIDDRRVDFVAQEAVTLSIDAGVARRTGCSRARSRYGFISPRPAANGSVMPGGFVRIAENADARAISLQRGDATADAWVLSDGPVSPVTLLPAPERVADPARDRHVAEPGRRQSVLGRPLRRARGGDAAAGPRHAQPHRRSGKDADGAGHRAASPSLLQSWGAAPQATPRILPDRCWRASVLMKPEFAARCRGWSVRRARTASVIRERFSPDAWKAIDDLVTMIETPLPVGPMESAMIERVEASVADLSSFSGLAQENMTRLAGWRFLELGRRIERALQTCRFVRRLPSRSAPERRARYAAGARRQPNHLPLSAT